MWLNWFPFSCPWDGVPVGGRSASLHCGGDDGALRVDCLCFCQDINHCHTPLFLCLTQSESDPPAPAESRFYHHSNQSQPQTKLSSAVGSEAQKMHLWLKIWSLRGSNLDASYFLLHFTDLNICSTPVCQTCSLTDYKILMAHCSRVPNIKWKTGFILQRIYTQMFPVMLISHVRRGCICTPCSPAVS